MSLLEKYAKGWGFRTHTPSFDVGEELSAFVTGVDDDGTPVVRVGDSIIRLEDADPGLVDKRVRCRVTGFDDDAHTGTAVYLETVGDSAF
ncbi:hypothetical protein G9C85_07780 [Halorubellus sp. JP-L1]|uniref:DUF7513 family protein n=1 Tax=Halorubellus sp. JP-L1 TaxID=2715753 RepID=UPI00140D7A24|nr:hypothetical protein [Halorubellus sp. JP-L1]NHN41537.1 hypothetical protein [Halorubellus sp. JP-L1]